MRVHLAMDLIVDCGIGIGRTWPRLRPTMMPDRSFVGAIVRLMDGEGWVAGLSWLFQEPRYKFIGGFR